MYSAFCPQVKALRKMQVLLSSSLFDGQSALDLTLEEKEDMVCWQLCKKLSGSQRILLVTFPPRRIKETGKEM